MPTTTRAKSRPLSRSCPASPSPKPLRRTLMSISYQFGDVDAHGAMIRSQAASLEAEHQSIVRDVLAAGDFWGGSGSVGCQEIIRQLGLTPSPSKGSKRTGHRDARCVFFWRIPRLFYCRRRRNMLRLLSVRDG